MVTESATRWEALLGEIRPDRSARQILFDPMVEDWAFAGLSEEYQEMVRKKQHSDQERAILLDRLRWVVQKRLTGRPQEVMLLFLAGYSQVEIADSLRISRSTVRRILVEAGDNLKRIIGSTEGMHHEQCVGGRKVRLLPLDTEEDFKGFAQFIGTHKVMHVALGTFADLREALVIFTD
jgi:DNA-binding CsgD family transcriptional regulator